MSFDSGQYFGYERKTFVIEKLILEGDEAEKMHCEHAYAYAAVSYDRGHMKSRCHNGNNYYDERMECQMYSVQH